MTKVTKFESIVPPSNRSPRYAEIDSYKRRVKAARLSRNDPPPKNDDEMRYKMARLISMGIDNWHGCPERLCRRQRGCMAPNILCSNLEYDIPVSEHDYQLFLREFRDRLRSLSMNERAEEGPDE